MIERASPADRAFVAMADGGAPQQMGVVLVMGPGVRFDVEAVRRLIGHRLGAIPRLRQRLVRVPLGCGGPVWIDDPGFDIARHVRAVPCPAPGDERALLDVAESVVSQRLSLTAPPWRAVLVTGLEDDRSALIVVLHHVLADGVGGLAVLAGLADHVGNGHAHDVFPRRPPTRQQLVVDALRRKLRSVTRIGPAWRLLRSSLSAGGGLRPPRAAHCSLVQHTGARRRFAVVRVDLGPLSRAAHRRGATTNDAVLVAIGGALHRVLRDRGENLDRIAVAVPVSGRGGTDPAMGNFASPMLVDVPVTGEEPGRLRQVADHVAASKPAARGPAPIALLGWAFRPLAARGAYRWYMNHQRRMHTLVSHVRGPVNAVAFGGVPITAAIPIALGDNGNITVYFEVLSYAGKLTTTIIADPDKVPDLDAIADALRAELRQPPC